MWSADRKSAEELEAKKKDLEEKMNAKGTVVYAIRDIQEGSVITAEALEQREIEQSKIPQAAVTQSSMAVSKKARYGVSQGQILSAYDLNPYPPGHHPMRVKNGKLVQ